MLGCLRRIFHLHQPEDLASYLRNVHDIWSTILLKDPTLFCYLDHETVKMVQSRNPSRYKTDAVYLRAQMDTGTIFSQIKDDQKRATILSHLLQIQLNISSIDTFQEDTKWLEPCSVAIREQLVPKSKISLRRALRLTYSGPLSIAPTKSGRDSQNDDEATFELAYKKLFVFAWQYFPGLTGISPKQDQGRSKQ